MDKKKQKYGPLSIMLWICGHVDVYPTAHPDSTWYVHSWYTVKCQKCGKKAKNGSQITKSNNGVVGVSDQTNTKDESGSPTP